MTVKWKVFVSLGALVPEVKELIEDINQKADKFGGDQSFDISSPIGTMTAEFPDDATNEQIENVRKGFESEMQLNNPKAKFRFEKEN